MGELGQRGGSVHQAPRAPLHQRRPCPRPSSGGGGGTGAGPGPGCACDPGPKALVPVLLPGAGARKPRRLNGLGAEPKARTSGTPCAAQPHPTTVPFRGSPVIRVGPPLNASEEKRGVGQQPGSSLPGLPAEERPGGGCLPPMTG